jgi:hypothetical protein
MRLKALTATAAVVVLGAATWFATAGGPAAELIGKARGERGIEAQREAGGEREANDPDAFERSGATQVIAPRAMRAPLAPLPSGFDSERVWGTGDDWEPMVAADPTTAANVYQMTTRYTAKACGTRKHCIMFRSSADGGTTWSADIQMCAACKSISAQNDPEMKVASDGTIYATWMNDWSVVFSKSADKGKTWSAPVDLKKLVGKSFTDKPIIAISPTGQDVYVAFNSSDSYVAYSHDKGATWKMSPKINSDTLYYFAEGGAVAPNGTVYFAESAEAQAETGPINLTVQSSSNGGVSWMNTVVDVSQQQPPCTLSGCGGDFYGAQINLAIDKAGTILVTYAKSTVSGGPMTLYSRTSTNGTTWSAPVALPTGATTVGADFPVVTAGPTAGDFRVAWMDDRNGATAWNTWFSKTTNTGGTWSTPVRLSDLGSGAAYKTANGFTFPYGDYMGMTTNSAGTNFIVWPEGASYAGPGGTWFTKG